MVELVLKFQQRTVSALWDIPYMAFHFAVLIHKIAFSVTTISIIRSWIYRNVIFCPNNTRF